MTANNVMPYQLFVEMPFMKSDTTGMLSSNLHQSSSIHFQLSLQNVQNELEKCQLNNSERKQDGKKNPQIAIVAPTQWFNAKPMFPKTSQK